MSADTIDAADTSTPQADDLRCPICLHPATNPAHIKSCNHTFCLDCLRTWSSSRHNPKCPLCQAEIAFLCHAGGEEPITEPPSGQPDVSPPDLGCLDHSYFANEASRLLRRARSAQHTLAATAYGCGRRGSAQADLASEALHEVIISLDERKSYMEDEIPFDPGEVLQELYCLEEVLCSIQDGSFGGNTGNSGAGGPQSIGNKSYSRRTRLSAADLQDLSSGDEQYLYDDSDDEDGDVEEELARHIERLGRVSLGGGTGVTPGGGKKLAAKNTPTTSSNHGRQKSKGSKGSLSHAWE